MPFHAVRKHDSPLSKQSVNIAPPTSLGVARLLMLFDWSSKSSVNKIFGQYLIWRAVRRGGGPGGPPIFDEFDTEPNADLTI